MNRLVSLLILSGIFFHVQASAPLEELAVPATQLGPSSSSSPVENTPQVSTSPSQTPPSQSPSTPVQSVPFEVASQEDDQTASGHPCDQMENFSAQQCCHRAERLNNLQKKEFSLENSKGETLYQLQKKHDQEMANLKILEGVHRLQEDYLDFMNRLKDPHPDSNLGPLKTLTDLQTRASEAADKAFRLKFLHDSLAELAAQEGAQDLRPSEHFENIKQNCTDSNSEEGLCSLLNPNSAFNKNAEQSVRHSDIKRMVQSYFKTYHVAQDGLSEEQKQQRHQEFEQALARIPRSVLEKQTQNYTEHQNELASLLGATEEGSDIQRCLQNIRYLVASECPDRITNLDLLKEVRQLNDRADEFNQGLYDQAFKQSLSEAQKDLLEEGFSKLDPAQIKTRHNFDHSLSDQEMGDFSSLLNNIESELELASELSSRRAASSPGDFLSSLHNMAKGETLAQLKDRMMAKLCERPNQDYERQKILECLQETTKTRRDLAPQKIEESKQKLAEHAADIKEIIESDEYKNINSFKNYYAYQSQEQCAPRDEHDEGWSISGDCRTSFDGETRPVSQLVDDTDKVISEITLKTPEGRRRGIEEVTALHEFCYNLDDEQMQQDFQYECERATSNYFAATKDNSEFDPKTQEYLRNNMTTYNPETNEIEYVQRQSGWSMLGINLLRGMATSIPQVMQYHGTKSTLPFMRHQALAQKYNQYWMQQHFNATFFNPQFNYTNPSFNFNPNNTNFGGSFGNPSVGFGNR